MVKNLSTNSSDQTVLLGLEARGLHAWEALVKSLKVARQIGTVVAASSVIRENAAEDETEVLRAVLKVETHKSPQEIIIQIKTSSSLAGDMSIFNLVLLSYMQQFSMTPEVTLPHPDLIGETRWLILASEIDADWIHPILNTSLETLAKPLRFSKVYDFYAQGQTLLAFSEAKF